MITTSIINVCFEVYLNRNSSVDDIALLRFGLILSISKDTFISSTSGEPPRESTLKSLCVTRCSHTNMWSLTPVEHCPARGFPVRGEVPECSQVLTLK